MKATKYISLPAVLAAALVAGVVGSPRISPAITVGQHEGRSDAQGKLTK